MGSLQLAMGTAASVTMLLLGTTSWSYAGHDPTASLVQAALSGLAYFAMAVLGNQMSSRLASAGLLARRNQAAARALKASSRESSKAKARTRSRRGLVSRGATAASISMSRSTAPGFFAARTLAAPMAAGMATLVEDEKQLGATVLDMGGGTTGMAVFADGGRLASKG